MQYWWRELLCLGSLSPGWSLAWPEVALTVKCSYFLSSISFVNYDTNLVIFSRRYSREANKKLQAHNSMGRTLEVRSLTPKHYCSWLKYPLLFLTYGLSKAKTAKWEPSANLHSTVGEIATKFSSNIRIKSLNFFLTSSTIQVWIIRPYEDFSRTVRSVNENILSFSNPYCCWVYLGPEIVLLKAVKLFPEYSAVQNENEYFLFKMVLLNCWSLSM